MNRHLLRGWLALATSLTCACHATIGVDAGAGIGHHGTMLWGWHGGTGIDIGPVRVGLDVEGVAYLEGSARHYLLVSIGLPVAVTEQCDFVPSLDLGAPFAWDAAESGGLVGATLGFPVSLEGRREEVDRNKSVSYLGRTGAIVPVIRLRGFLVSPNRGDEDTTRRENEPFHVRAGVELQWLFGSELLE